MRILCGTIGSPESKRAEERAIELARQYNAELIFVYIVDTGFLDGLERKLHGKNDINIGLQRIGELILKDAQKRAHAAGIEAKIEVIQDMNILEGIELLIKEQNIDILVIGKEKRGLLEKHLIGGEVYKFVDSIAARTGVRVEVVE
jgi:nucleotide-binding universal stress UspA family protein